MVFRRINKSSGYEISGVGVTKRNLIDLSGLQLVIENTK